MKRIFTLIFLIFLIPLTSVAQEKHEIVFSNLKVSSATVSAFIENPDKSITIPDPYIETEEGTIYLIPENGAEGLCKILGRTLAGKPKVREDNFQVFSKFGTNFSRLASISSDGQFEGQATANYIVLVICR